MSAAPDTVAPPPAPPPRRRSRLRWLWWLLAIVVLVVLVALGVAAWLLTTSSGAQFALDRAAKAAGPGTRFEGVEGRIGGELRIRQVEISRPDLYARIDDLVLDTEPFAPLRGELVVNRLGARSVEVRTLAKDEPAKIPSSFAPPFAIELRRGEIAELRKGELSREAAAESDVARRRALFEGARAKDLVVRDIFLKGAGDSGAWRIDEARATTDYGKASVAGKLQARSPFALDARLAAEGVAAERPYKAALTARGTLKRIEAALEGEVSGQRATGRATLEPFAPVPVRALELHARDVDLSKHAAGPRTRLAVDVQLAAESGAAYAGPVRIENAEPGPWDRQQLPFSTAQARVIVTQERIDVADLHLVLAGGGSVAGRATLQKSGVQAELRVAEVDLAALHGKLQKTSVTGSIAAKGDRAAQRFEVALKDPRFGIEGRAALANQVLDVETARVTTGGGAVTATGTLALEGRREFRFEGRADHFDPSAFVKTTKGDLNFAFVTSGALADGIAGRAKLDIAPSTYAGLPAGGRVDIAGDAKRIARADVDVTLGEARVTAKGSFGRAGDAMDVGFRVPNLSTVGKAFGVAVAGRIEGEGRLTGTFQSPAGRIALKGANLALPSDVFVRELSLRGEAGVEPDSPIDVNVQARGVAMGEERPPTTMAESATATLKGTRVQHRLEIAADMNKQTQVRAAFAGGLDPRAAAPSWNGRIESLAMTGRGAFNLVSPAPLALSAARAELGQATLRGTWGEAQLVTTRWTPRTLELKGTSPGIEIQNLARSLRLGATPRSNLVVALDWDVRAKESFDATLDMRRVSGDVRIGQPPLPLGLQALELHADVVRGKASARLTIAGERAGQVQGEGTGSIVRGKTGWEFAQDAPVSARVVATHTNLAAIAAWLGPDAKLGGRLNASVVVSGTGADPRIAGTARAESLVVREPQSGFELENGTIALRLDGTSVVIDELRADTPWNPSARALQGMRRVQVPAGGGHITAEGSIDLKARQGALRVKADKVPVTQLQSRFLAISGEASLRAGAEGMFAGGEMRVDAGWIGALDTPPPSPSEDVVVVRAAQPAPAPEAKGEPIRVDVKVSLGERLYFQGRGLDTRLAGDIHVTGQVGAGGLRAEGVIRTVGGSYDGYGQKLQIERGEITFNGPVDNPRLNVLALRKGLAVEAGVEVFGTATRPRVRLVSRPDVPEPEKLSWLVLGRGAADASLGDSALMMAAARALLGSNNPGSSLTDKLGIDEFKIGRSDANSILGVLPQSTVAGRTGTPSASETVSIGRRVNRNLHLTYEQGLADAEGALKLTWRISRQFQLLARTGYLPGLDAVYRWTFK